MSIAKSDLESQARRWWRSFFEASFPNPNPRSRGRSLSEANRNLLSLSGLLFLLCQSDFLKPSPKSKRRGRKPNPNPRRWGRLSREDLSKLSPKEREDWFKLSLTERREILLLIKEEEIKQQHKKEQKKAHQQLFISDASVTPNTTKKELSALICDALLISKAKASVTPNTIKEQLSTVVRSEEKIKQQHKKATKEQVEDLIALIREACDAQQLLISNASVTPNTTKEELSASPTVVAEQREEMIHETIQLYLAEQREEMIREAVQLYYTTKKELSTSPTVVHGSSDLWTWLSPKEKEDWDKLIKKVAEQREEMIREAIQLYLAEQREDMIREAVQLYYTTKKELSASPTVVHSLSEITTTKQELLAPPTSEENPWQSILGCSEAEWIAELQSMGNICQICGHTNHVTLECSYLVEIPPDAKIVNESEFEIACKYCSMPLVTGACVNECLPPTRRKVIQKPVDIGWALGGLPRKEFFAKDLPKKELFAPPSSEMVVHSSSEETATPCIHGLSSSSSLKLNGELHARATTPRFAFPDVPACIHGLSSSSSLKLNGELHARATTKPFAFPDMPACKSNKSAFCFPDVPAMPDVKCQICGANHWSAVCSLVTENPTGCKSYQ